MLWLRLWSFSWWRSFRSWSDSVANLLTPVAMALSIIPLLIPPPLLALLVLFAVVVVVPAEWGRLLERGKVVAMELMPGVLAPLLFPLVVLLEVLVIIVAPAGGLVAFMTLVCVRVRERGRCGKRMSSVRSHRHS